MSDGSKEATDFVKIIKHKMLAPLVRVKIEPEEKLDFQLAEGIKIIAKDPEIFKLLEIEEIDFNAHDVLSTTNKYVFMQYPLLYMEFPYREDSLDTSSRFFDLFVKVLALFKTTNTKLKTGIRLVVNYNEKKRNGLVISGSDDYLESARLPYYILKKDELESFKKFFGLCINSLLKIKNEKVLDGIEFYSKASRSENIVEKFIFLSLTLEFLFSKENDELTNRFANRAALLLGKNYEQRTKIVKNVKELYAIRSGIVHGTSTEPPSVSEFAYFNELMRSAILQQMSLSLSGSNDIITELDSFILKQNDNDYSKFKENAQHLFGNFSEFQYADLNRSDVKLVK